MKKDPKIFIQHILESIEKIVHKKHKQKRISKLEVFGVDKGKIKPFTEEDRGENPN